MSARPAAPLVRMALLGAVALAAAVPAAGAHPARHATLPAVSPDGRLVAYVRELGRDSCELRVSGLDGAGDRLLWRPARGGGVPGWSEGGRRVTLVSSPADTGTMWSVGLERGDVRVEASLAGKALSRSRDGRRLAWAVGDWRRSVLTVGDARGGGARALTDAGAAWFNIAWSPDDRTLAATRLDATGDMQVWLVDVASGRARALTAFTAVQGHPQWPAWSPDGCRIAVQAGRYDPAHPEKNEADVWVIDVASGRAARVGERAGVWMDETPSWCADGRRIAFQSSRTGRFEVWVARDDGTGAVQVTR